MHNQIYELELSLLDPANRKNITFLDQLIAPDFIEFGSSGKTYNKSDIVNHLPSENERHFTVTDFKTLELANNVILATYLVSSDAQHSLRSSIWKLDNNVWRLVFHQGTPCIR